MVFLYLLTLMDTKYLQPQILKPYLCKPLTLNLKPKSMNPSWSFSLPRSGSRTTPGSAQKDPHGKSGS